MTTQTSSPTIIDLEQSQGFDEVVAESPVPVVADFHAPWCGPCRAQGPVLHQFARERGERVRLVKVNVDEHPDLARRYGVQSIPTLIVFERGNEKTRLIGLQSLDDLRKAIGS